jgi:hypothetical protein
MPDKQDMPPASATTGADIDEALAHAEALMTSAENAARTCRGLLAAEAGTVALAIVAVTLLVVFSRGTGAGRLVVASVVILLLGVLIAGTIHLLLTLPMRKRVRRDARSTMVIIDFLREVIPLVAEREGWSQTRVRIAEARIARFPIDADAIR